MHVISVTNIFLVAPTITPGVLDQTENEGNNVSFTCQITSEPVSIIGWYYNGALLNETSMDNKYSIKQLSSFNSTTYFNMLTIIRVESSDVGTYTCNATNIISSDTSSGVLTVNGELIHKFIIFYVFNL